jgi:rhamnulokinase
MVNVRSHDWCREIFSITGLSLAAAPQIVQPGTDIGKVAGPLTECEAFRNTRIIAPACHDTASAIAGIPAEGDDWAFISSGTWSLIGTIVPHYVISEAARNGNFTNQGGVGGSTYFLKNVNGMWILRQCVEQWRAEGVEWQLTELLEACEELDKPSCLINVDDAALMMPCNMPARINAQLCASGVAPLPENASGAPMYAGLIFHSLAARYAQVLKDIAAITGKRLSRVFIVGGGSRNRYLNRLIEETTQLQVIPGSAESSTIGNFAIQLAAAEKIPGASGASADAVSRWADILNRISASVRGTLQ